MTSNKPVKSLGTEKFWLAYHSLPPDTKEAARAAHQKFLQNPAHPSLQLERLRSDPRFWSVRVTRDYRASSHSQHNFGLRERSGDGAFARTNGNGERVSKELRPHESGAEATALQDASRSPGPTRISNAILDCAGKAKRRRRFREREAQHAQSRQNRRHQMFR